MRAYKAEGIVIKRRNFGEADRILTVFSKHNGKIQVKAPGVRRITSRRSYHIELLNRSIFTLYQSHKSLYPVVTEAQVLEDFSSIKNNLEKIGLAYYICELVDRLCPQNQENRRVFFLVRDTLLRLANNGTTCLPLRGTSGQVKQWNNETISEFENDLLVALGFLPKLNYLEDRHLFIEEILERKLFAYKLLPSFLQST